MNETKTEPRDGTQWNKAERLDVLKGYLKEAPEAKRKQYVRDFERMKFEDDADFINWAESVKGDFAKSKEPEQHHQPKTNKALDIYLEQLERDNTNYSELITTGSTERQPIQGLPE